MIEYIDIYKSFGENVVLAGVDLAVRAGETFFVLGKTGTGKTVLIRLVVGLMRADRGKVLVDGEDVTGFSEEEFGRVREKCGMVFQLPTLLDSLSVFENVAFGLRRRHKLREAEVRERVTRALTQVELDPALGSRLPSELSFGEQKRVGLARTVVLEPRYLLYDEPTTGLDPFTAGRIDELIKGINRELGATAIVVSHDLESMKRIADRVGLLDAGRFHFIGPVDEFFRSSDAKIAEFRSSADQETPV
jgi:phospholipid/cholesterol/gamma-HCH transport system ATP-binding protein